MLKLFAGCVPDVLHGKYSILYTRQKSNIYGALLKYLVHGYRRVLK